MLLNSLVSLETRFSFLKQESCICRRESGFRIHKIRMEFKDAVSSCCEVGVEELCSDWLTGVKTDLLGTSGCICQTTCCLVCFFIRAVFKYLVIALVLHCYAL